VNNSQQNVGLFFLLLFVAITIGFMTQAEAMKSNGPQPYRNFHASAGVPVESTDEPFTMKLRDSKAASFEPKFKIDYDHEIVHEIPNRYDIDRPHRYS